MNIKLIFKPSFHVFAQIGRHLFTSDKPANLYKRTYKEEIKDRDYHLSGLIGDLLGSIIVIGSIIAALTGAVAAITALIALMSPPSQPDQKLDEMTGFNNAITCMEKTCDQNECIEIYINQFPKSHDIPSLEHNGSKIINGPLCKKEEPDKPSDARKAEPPSDDIHLPVVSGDQTNGPETGKTRNYNEPAHGEMPVTSGSQSIASIWEKKGFNISTMRDLPVFMSTDAPTGTLEHAIERDLSEALQLNKKVNLVQNPSEAALLLKVLHVVKGQPTYDLNQITLNISFDLTAYWMDGKSCFIDKTSMDGKGISISFKKGEDGDYAATRDAIQKNIQYIINNIDKESCASAG